MVDVSVRFATTNDSEVVLNLSLPQAVRLMEALAGEVGDTLSGRGGAPFDGRGLPPAGAPRGVPDEGHYVPAP